jgi:superfamily II DNA or RNA helicase
VSNEIDPKFNRSKKQLLVDKFCLQDYHVLWANIQTMKEGFNIPQASRGIFMEYSWNAIDWQQALARMLRPAQKRAVHGKFLCHEGTADEYVAAYVQLKARSEQEGVDHQSFDDFTGAMVPDFRLYAEAIVEGNVKAMMQKMQSDLDKLKEMSGE